MALGLVEPSETRVNLVTTFLNLLKMDPAFRICTCKTLARLILEFCLVSPVESNNFGEKKIVTNLNSAQASLLLEVYHRSISPFIDKLNNHFMGYVFVDNQNRILIRNDSLKANYIGHLKVGSVSNC